ncbi:MAG: 50S ribosomal protein L11 methyltransferase [Clostridia bacterium]|nr:50S ribosomal protein L11 methyltransferase [Clostridia bacterium]
MEKMGSDYGYSYSTWTQIRVTGKLEQLNDITAIMSMIDVNLQIEDYSDIDLKSVYGDLIDEAILNADKTIASVSVYIPEEKSYTDAIAFIKDRLNAENIDAKVEVIGVDEEDWANSWKQYYKPLHIGRIVIVPAWEKYEATDGEIVVTMDPGMAFGTGSHETTRLEIELLQKYVTAGCNMLDVGTGSGILAICASKLGAGECEAYDIDPMAVRVARENVEGAGIKNIKCAQSNLLGGIEKKPFDVICANIVADIILRMLPDIHEYMHEKTVLLASGIISERAQEILDALDKNGLRCVDFNEDNGWCAIGISLK